MPTARRRHPMTPQASGRRGGLRKLIAHGPDAYREMGRKGAAGLDARIAAAAGIDPGDPDYATKLAAARRLYYMDLAEARWARRGSPPKVIRPAMEELDRQDGAEL